MKKELAIKIFNELLEELEMNPKQLSDSLGKDRPQWAYDILNEKVKVGISKNIAELICEKYPHINKSWLLTGEGDMLNPDQQSSGENVNYPNEAVGRIRQIINDNFNGSIPEFCERLMLRQATIITALGRNIPPSHEIVMAILNDESLNISAEWLITGRGEPYKKEGEESPKISYTAGVPYYNVDFIGGFDLVMNDQTINPEYLIDFKKYNDAMCWCNVTGHSMEPEINNGDMIALKEVKSWRDYLPFGEVYGIVTDEHRTIKRVTSSLKGENYFRLIPTNKSEEYQPQDIPTRLIIAVYKVLGCNKRL